MWQIRNSFKIQGKLFFPRNHHHFIEICTMSLCSVLFEIESIQSITAGRKLTTEHIISKIGRRDGFPRDIPRVLEAWVSAEIVIDGIEE